MLWPYLYGSTEHATFGKNLRAFEQRVWPIETDTQLLTEFGGEMRRRATRHVVYGRFGSDDQRHRVLNRRRVGIATAGSVPRRATVRRGTRSPVLYNKAR